MKSRPHTKGVTDVAPPLPHNVDAERALLEAIILDGQVPNATLCFVIERVSNFDFLHDSHQRIFRRMLAMSEANVPVDLVTIVEGLKHNAELDAAGGAAYVAKLIDGVPRVSNVEHYARIVREKSVLRQCAQAGQAITQAALQRNASAETILISYCTTLRKTIMKQAI